MSTPLLPPTPAAATPLPTQSAPTLQRRYSVSGKTLPEDVGAMKSPLQALDTSVQATTCGLCEGAATGTEVDNIRTSSKRSATQLPSPSTPSSQELPTKIARLGLEHHGLDFGVSDECLTDPGPDEGEWLEDDDISLTPLLPPIACDCEHMSQDTVDDEAGKTQEITRDIESDFGGAVTQALSSLNTLESSPLPEVDDISELYPPEFTLDPVTLLTLPPELRHQIYLRLPDLVLPYPLIYCLSTFANKKQHPLAAVSRQIRAEALFIFYSYNVWIIKLEFKIMYDAFQDWIIRLGPDAGSLRIVHIAVRGRLFKPWTSHSSFFMHHNNVQIPGGGGLTFIPGGPSLAGVPARVEAYSPPDGDASFRVDLSEKWAGGRVELLRNDGTQYSGSLATAELARLVAPLWEKRKLGLLNGQDWVNLVDSFLRFTGGGTW